MTHEHPAPDVFDNEPEELLYALAVLSEGLVAALDETQEQEEPEPPRRNSPQYRRMMKDLSLLENMGETVGALSVLWEDYGWRAPLDLMTEWVIQIHTHPHTGPEARDMFGAVDLGFIILLAPDEGQVLQIAATQAEKPEFSDLPPHEAFALAVRLSEEASRLGTAWKPTFRAAFQAAHNNPGRTPHLVTREGRIDVFAALCQGPGRDNRDDVLRAGLTLATAAMGVRNRDAMAQRFLRLKKEEVFSNSEVNPQWGEVGFRRTKR